MYLKLCNDEDEAARIALWMYLKLCDDEDEAAVQRLLVMK
jgi:hypothetical protein